ncbi:MAG TPA: response regulator [bacterium]|nr:response regulator [bacterium]
MKPIRLLMVDDEEIFLSSTRTLLERRGLTVSTAGSGTDALQVLDERPIDVVVLDVRMPGMDGVETLRKIKQRHPLVEVIMLTGHATVDSAVEGLKLGAFDYLMKPWDLPDFLDKVEQARRKKEAAEERQRKTAKGADAGRSRREGE